MSLFCSPCRSCGQQGLGTGWGTKTVWKGLGEKGKCLQGSKIPVSMGDKQSDTQRDVGDASQLLLGPGCDPLCWGREAEKGAETTRFGDVRAFLLPGYPRKPSRLSGGTGWYLLYLRERVRERVLIAQHARELLWPVIR